MNYRKDYEERFPKRDCKQYYICITDIDWRPEHCKNCHQYEGKIDEVK